MKKQINDLLPVAMRELRASELLREEQTAIRKEDDGYVASFAPSVITAGLKATLSFYTDTHKSKPKRNRILDVLHNIYKKVPGHLNGPNLLEIALAANQKDERQLRNDLIACAIALKLVMRNFKQIEADI
jgi:CRISPR/Cas system CMR-associated protein Cmr5 small subunit